MQAKTRKKRLGRGLDALLGDAVVDPEEQQEFRQVPIDLLRRGQYQPRTRMDPEALQRHFPLAAQVDNRSLARARRSSVISMSAM